MQIVRDVFQACRELLHRARDADRPAAIAEMALELTDDRRERERRERQPALRLEAIDGLQQPDCRDLFEIVGLVAGAVALRQHPRKREETLHQSRPRGLVTVTQTVEQRTLVTIAGERQQRRAVAKPWWSAGFVGRTVGVGTRARHFRGR